MKKDLQVYIQKCGNELQTHHILTTDSCLDPAAQPKIGV